MGKGTLEMSTYNQDIKTLLTNLGKDLTLRHVTKGTYDPTTGELSSDTITDTTAKGAITSYSAEDRQDTRIEVNDRKCILSGVDITTTPDINDLLVDGSTVYTIINASKIEYNDEDIVYICQIRR